jgi:predicted permease
MWARWVAAVRRLGFAWRRRRLDEETRCELDAHLDLLVDRYVRAGLSREDAYVAARQQLGNLTLVREEIYQMNSAGLVSDMVRDGRYALRGFARTPGFTAAVVLILAIGIGANAAIFSIMEALIFGNLPYPDGEQLVAVYDSQPPFDYNVTTPENWVEWQRESRSFSWLAAWGYLTGLTLTGAGDPVTLTGQLVSAEFLPLLGIEPMLGRVFTQEEDRPNAPRVVILSHGLWQRRFGRDPDILGRTVELNGNPHEIVGVMPEGFSFVPANGPANIDYWMPFALNRSLPSTARFIFVLGRLRPGVTPEAAQSEMSALNERLVDERGYGEQWRVNVAPLQADRVRDVRTSLLLLFAAVGALVLLACFNVAGLLLARGVHRRQEMAIRVALGAGRAAIVRQLVTEGLILALAGAGLGMLVSRWTVGGLVALAPFRLLETVELGLDGTVLLYILGLSMATAIVFTLAPALTSGRELPGSHLAAVSRTVTRTTRLRQGLVIAQVALALVLVSGAGLLGRTLQELLGGDAGLNAENVLSLPVSLPAPRYDRTAQIAFFRQAVERLGNLPGVQSAGAGRTLPITGVTYSTLFHVEGTPEIPPVDQRAGSDAAVNRVREVTPGYFRTLSVPVVRGRDFSPDDLREGAPPVFIVNQAFVRQYFPASDPLDAAMSLVPTSMEPTTSSASADILDGRIVGVVGDVKEGSLRMGAAPVVFVDHSHVTFTRMTLFVRADRTLGLPQAAVQVIREMDPNLAVTPVWLEDVLAATVARDRMNATVLGAFAATALVLAAFGLYGLLVYVVADRTREIGIRMALGAGPRDVLVSVVGQGMRLVIPGVVLGLAGALALSRSLESFLYGVTQYDAPTLAGGLVLLLSVALAAIWIPSHRATRVDPLIALREDQQFL